jgi:hypothetical protein
MNDTTARRARGLVVAGLSAAAFAVTLAACSGGGSSSSTPGTGTVTTAPSSAPAATAAAQPASTPTAASSLAGSWSGQYSGAYSGTFTLTWHQTGSKLQGTIHISAPADTMPINGTVNGTSIEFGTVGSTAITYSGTVSGSSMSGNYQVNGQGASSGGPWSAARS